MSQAAGSPLVDFAPANALHHVHPSDRETARTSLAVPAHARSQWLTVMEVGKLLSIRAGQLEEASGPPPLVQIGDLTQTYHIALKEFLMRKIPLWIVRTGNVRVNPNKMSFVKLGPPRVFDVFTPKE